MRLLHALDGKVPIWPMDPLPESGSVVVEIYTRIFLRRAGMPGSKLRSRAALNLALEGPWPPRRGCGSSPTTTRPMRWLPPRACGRWPTTSLAPSIPTA